MKICKASKCTSLAIKNGGFLESDQKKNTLTLSKRPYHLILLYHNIFWTLEQGAKSQNSPKRAQNDLEKTAWWRECSFVEPDTYLKIWKARPDSVLLK